jgi:hypothetical protein
MAHVEGPEVFMGGARCASVRTLGHVQQALIATVQMA